jgi:hypothetical protein
LNPEEQRLNLEALGKKNQEALADLLSTQQSHRLQQIALQAQSFHAFSDPEVEKALQLTNEQKEKIGKQQADACDAVSECLYPTGKHGQELHTPEEIRKRAQAKIIRILTPEQRALWQTMVGTLFHGEIYFGPRGITVR